MCDTTMILVCNSLIMQIPFHVSAESGKLLRVPGARKNTILQDSSTGTCSVRCIKLHMFKTMQIKNNIHNNNKHNNTVMIKTET